MKMYIDKHKDKIYIGALFLLARFVMVISIPLEGLKSYGDFWNYYKLAAIGTPFIDLWIEFPPLFPLLSRLFFIITGGRESTYVYSLIVFFSIIQAANVFLFQKIASSIFSKAERDKRVLSYGFILVGLFYGWTYFDSLGVFCLLSGFLLLMNKKHIPAGIVLGIGGLFKWFPVLLLPAAWKWSGPKKAIRTIVAATIIVIIVWGLFYSISPSFTSASFISQGVKGSWETVWALVDGNLSTGNFNPDIDRQIVETATLSTGNPSRISPWLLLPLFAAIGLMVFIKSDLESIEKLISFSGFTLILFFLWLPGYSPQWILYLLPLVLLGFNFQRSLLLGMILIFVNLLEWPVLLSRGWFHLIEEIILLRTGIFLLLAGLFAQTTLRKGPSEKKEDLEFVKET